MSKDEMVVSTIIDLIKDFDNSDGVLDSDSIKRNIDKSFTLSKDDIMDMFKDTIDYLKKETRPKTWIHLQNKCLSYQSDNLCDSGGLLQPLPFSQNMSIINDVLRYPFSKSTIYEYCHDKGIKTDIHKNSDTEIIDIININLSYRKNYELIKGQGIKVGDKGLKRLYNEKKKR